MNGRRMIYVVESGEYSDYGVICAFEREEDAQATNVAGIGDSYRGMILFAPGTMPKRTVLYWLAEARAGGSYDSPPVAFPSTQDDSEELEPKPAEIYAGRPKTEVRQMADGGLMIQVKAATREDALKAASDRYAKHRAEMEGL